MKHARAWWHFGDGIGRKGEGTRQDNDTCCGIVDGPSAFKAAGDALRKIAVWLAGGRCN